MGLNPTPGQGEVYANPKDAALVLTAPFPEAAAQPAAAGAASQAAVMSTKEEEATPTGVRNRSRSPKRGAAAGGSEDPPRRPAGGELTKKVEEATSWAKKCIAQAALANASPAGEGDDEM